MNLQLLDHKFQQNDLNKVESLRQFFQHLHLQEQLICKASIPGNYKITRKRKEKKKDKKKY